MIFKVSNDFANTESYKERNLYYKMFAGYLFNELIPDENIRKKGFIDLMINTISKSERSKGEDLIQLLNEVKKEEIQVTFDYHSAQIIDEHKKNNRGEMSDVLLMTSNYFISIECKYLSDMHFEKDIVEVQGRIIEVEKVLNRKAIQVLLLKEEKWKNMKGFEAKENSFYKMFINSKTAIPIVVLFWEDLFPLINDKRVGDYLISELKRKN